MPKTYKITYRKILVHKTMYIEANSKYEAKQKFKRMYPEWDYLACEEVSENDNPSN